MKISKFEKGTILDEIEIDYYVPIRLIFPLNDNGIEELYYFRFINQKSSFIEAKINSKTKKIVGVTVTSINDIKDSEFLECELEERNPIIETDIFNKDRVITKEADFDVLRGNTNIFFKLNEEKLSIVVKMSEHLSLLLNKDNEVIGMVFSGFSKQEWLKLNESIKGYIAFKSKTT